ncbi:MAG: hypothetical protein MI739_13095 [Bacteroidales bacterium]|nr:hypothetical protein [Bacteroidales bacterium]
MKIKSLLIYSLLIILGLVQCKSNKRSETNESNSESTVISTEEQVVYMLPAPDEIFAEIFISDIRLDIQYINSVDNAVNYIDVKSQALNLGVYITDFAYLSVFDNTANELDYLKTIKELTDKVNLYGVVSEGIIERINANLLIKDSLNKISRELYYKMSQILENSDQNNLLVLVSTGAIIEALYLAINNITFKHSADIVERVLEQKFVFDNYYEFAQQYSDDVYVKSVLSQLSGIKKIFDDFSYDETNIKVTKDKDCFIIIEGGKEIIVTEDVYLKLKEKIIDIRMMFVDKA